MRRGVALFLAHSSRSQSFSESGQAHFTADAVSVENTLVVYGQAPR
jgi:hypothetical protein